MLGYGFINDQSQFQFHKGTIRTINGVDVKEKYN